MNIEYKDLKIFIKINKKTGDFIMSKQILSKPEYERQIAKTRDTRMEWFRDARYGMFIHYGLYAQLGRNEWAMAIENYDIAEYEKLADSFTVKPDAAKEWVKLAFDSGMKYAVMTTRHHDGFSLWDSKANPYNSMNYGPKRDIVKEFVDACREYGLKIGFYSSLMDWHHPDGYACAYDNDARVRFTDYIYELNRELLINYGKIDILWYDVPQPMQSWEGWNSLERNQKLRELQPHIIINNRSRLDEDFGTPEGRITVMEDKDWEACMTFNDISWGYIDSELARPYSYTPHRILRMINTVTNGKGNLLLNIGPAPDGSVPKEAIEPLTTLGKWLKENGEAVYGRHDTTGYRCQGAAGTSCRDNIIYLWNWIWRDEGQMTLGGFFTKLKSAKFISGNDAPVDFVQEGARIILKNLPKESPDKFMNVPVIALEFEAKPEFYRASRFPQLHGGYLRSEDF